MDRPMVSIVMPAYNAERTIEEAIKSIIDQTYKNWELIIIDDCSTDRTLEKIQLVADKDERIRVLVNPENRGVSYSRNRGVLDGTGDWTAFLDSDDLWRCDKLEKQLTLMQEEKDAVLCYTASAFMDNDGNRYGYVMPAEKQTNLHTLLKRNIISCSSVMLQSKVMKQVEMPGDRMHEDYYVWLTLLQNGYRAVGINEPLLIYRLNSNSKSSGRLKSAKMLFNTYLEAGYSAMLSGLMTIRYSYHSIMKRYKIKRSRESA